MKLLLNIDVPDVETALRFYTAAFDLKVGRRFGADFVELVGWPATVYLLTKAAGTIGATAAARRILDDHAPSHLVSIERPGRTAGGDYLSARGQTVRPWNAPRKATMCCRPVW